MKSLAQKVAEFANDVQADRCVEGEIQWESFEDGFPNLFVHNADDLTGCDVVFVCSLLNPSQIFEQLAVVYAFPRFLVRSLTLVMPYFPTGTMERVDKEGQIATAKSLCRMLSQIPLSRMGPAHIVIFDIHALQERFYFGDTVVPRLGSAVPLLLDRLQLLPDKEDITIAFPDDGAWKRFHTFFDDYPDPIICNKVRDGDKRVVVIKEGNPKDRHVVIVDDLVKSGGTLIECAKALQARGSRQVSFWCTHGVFPNQTWKRFIDQGYKYFWVTDSCPEVAADVAFQPPFEVLSLAPIINKMLVQADFL